MKISSYIRRTELFTEGLRRGNISLKIINVTLTDEGIYRCFIPKLRSRSRASTVELVIKPNSDQTWTTEMPLHPRNLQTQDPTEDTFIRGGQASRSRLSLVWVLCVLLILSFGIRGYTLLEERLKQKSERKDKESFLNWELNLN
ncbi:CD276 antigen-like [Scomber scombrus]|uniref:CD276 antigen-like n=1 Tax=Scomber scombrus TaxID=13677 RepID=UPI002DDC8919|nr:CD276 antigen-like [Scomber scombrus]